jgi:hypothetical protein
MDARPCSFSSSFLLDLEAFQAPLEEDISAEEMPLFAPREKTTRGAYLHTTRLYTCTLSFVLESQRLVNSTAGRELVNDWSTATIGQRLVNSNDWSTIGQQQRLVNDWSTAPPDATFWPQETSSEHKYFKSFSTDRKIGNWQRSDPQR